MSKPDGWPVTFYGIAVRCRSRTPIKTSLNPPPRMSSNSRTLSIKPKEGEAGC